MKGDMMNFFAHRLITTVLFTLACWKCSGVEAIIVPSGKVGPITPYRSTPRPLADPSRPVREPAPVVEYSPENPEPPPLDASYVPPSYDTLQALSGNSVFYIPLRIKNVYGFKGINDVAPGGPPEVTWRGSYYSSGVGVAPVRAKVVVPVHQVDYAFPESERYRQRQFKPIIVAPLPPNYQPVHTNIKYKKSTATGDRLYPKKYWNPNSNAASDASTSTTAKYHQHYLYVKHVNQQRTTR